MIDYDRNIAEAARYYLAASAFSIFVYASNTLFHTVPLPNGSKCRGEYTTFLLGALLTKK